MARAASGFTKTAYIILRIVTKMVGGKFGRPGMSLRDEGYVSLFAESAEKDTCHSNVNAAIAHHVDSLRGLSRP
jgi:hypothetical protein